jgi:aquaglyceroporin related protein
MNQPGQHTPSNASSRSSSRPGLPHGLIGTSNVRATIRNSNRAPKYESASNQQAQRPQYSLARPFVSHTHVPSYVQPGYHELNPGYQEIQQAPLWGLAKPLPRVLRPGMRRQQEGAHGSRKPDVVENQQAEVEEPGSSEAIPQVGMINDQRNDAGKSSTRNGGVSSGERGYGNQDPAKMIRHPVAPRSRSDIVTPCEEKGNPMDVWKQNLTPDETPNPFVGYDDGDIGHARAQRLSNIYEFSSNEEFGGIHSRPAAHYALTEKSDEVDLENGDAVDWPVEKVDDEDHRTLAERDAYNRWSATRARFREPLAECLAVSSIIVTLTNFSNPWEI